MTNQQQEMIEYTTQEVVRYLIEDNGISMEQAMEQNPLAGVTKKSLKNKAPVPDILDEDEE